MGKKDYSSRLQDRWNSRQEKEKRKKEQDFQEFEKQLETFSRVRIGFRIEKGNTIKSWPDV